MNKRTVTRSIDGIQLTFECENLGFGYLDTKVFINEKYICWITFSDIDKFVDELGDVIFKYRI